MLLFTADFRYVSSVLSDQIRSLVLFLTDMNAGCFADTKTPQDEFIILKHVVSDLWDHLIQTTCVEDVFPMLLGHVP